MGYTPSFTPQYENGWEDLPSETSPITAEALNAYDDAIENIEDYLASDNSQANLADAYDETATYEAGDYVIYGGDLYKCLEDIDEPEEWDSTKWESCLITDEMATSGGTTVIANPSGQATETLTKLQVDETIYGVSGGGGNANIWTGTQAELEEVFDELEEGTQINITDDEQEVVEGGTIYSEEEQVIGLWTDNRPLYQKTYNVTFSSDAYAITIPSEIDIKTIIGGVDSANKTDFIHIGYGGGTSDSVQAYRTDATTLRFQNKYYSQRPNGEITLQYTKTTDAPLDAVVGKKTMYIANSDCYSTEEKEVGCWTDGKPLYQITADIGTIAANASKTIAYSDIGISNVDKIVYLDIMINNTHNSNFNRPDNVNTEFYTQIVATGIFIRTYNTAVTSAYATIQYTKTTDTAGSGQYTPASGKAVHYSTDEQVIGTWIDNKTLYQKTIVNTSLTSISNDSWSTFATINNIESIAMASMGTRNASGHREYVVGNITIACGNNIVEVIASGNSVNSANGFILNVQYTKSA